MIYDHNLVALFYNHCNIFLEQFNVAYLIIVDNLFLYLQYSCFKYRSDFVFNFYRI